MNYLNEYLHIISEMNQTEIKNLNENLQFNLQEFMAKYKDEPFLQHTSNDGKDEIDLTISNIKLNDKTVTVQLQDCEFYWSWDPGQNGGWTDPSWPAGVDQAYITAINCYCDITNKENNELITVIDQHSGQNIEFTSLSLDDRAKIIEAIKQYIDNDNIFDVLAQQGQRIVQDAKAEAAYQRWLDSQDRY